MPDGGPITSIIITEDSNVPNDYSTLTYTNTGDEADIGWSTTFKRKRRYISVSRRSSAHVITDVIIFDEDSPTPNDYIPIAMTHNNRDRALKDKIILVKYQGSDTSNNILVDVMLSYSDRPPGGYSLIGNVHKLFLFGRFNRGSQRRNEPIASPVNRPEVPRTLVGSLHFKFDKSIETVSFEAACRWAREFQPKCFDFEFEESVVYLSH